MMKKAEYIMVVAAVAIAVLSVVPDAKATVIFSDNFDSYNNGILAPQGGWAQEFGLDLAVHSTGYTGKGIKSSDPGTGETYSSHSITTYTTGIYTVEWNAIVGNSGNNRSRLLMDNTSAAGFAGVELGFNGVTGLRAALAGVNSWTVATDAYVWYNLRMIIDLNADTFTAQYKRYDAGTYSTLVSGQDLNNDTGTASGFTVNAVTFALQQNNAGSLPNDQAYADDIVVDYVPEPVTLTMLSLGGALTLLGTRRRRR